MSLLKIIRNWFLLFTILLSSKPAIANEAVCNSLGGSIMLRDAIYGGLIGGTGTGLAILATDVKKKQPQKLAQGALIGFGIGTAFGAYETFFKSCPRQETVIKSATVSYHPRPFISSEGHMGLSMKWALL